MINWHESMTQTFEYYMVDPDTWKDERPIENVSSCSINRDRTSSTLGSATIDCDEDLGECYFRAYLVVIQNGVQYKRPLGTYLLQTPSKKFDGRKHTVSIDAYTPLIELKEDLPPLGYSILKGTNIMESAYAICREHMRAPVVPAKSTKTLYDDFVANTDDVWVTFVSDLISNAEFELYLDELGRVLFEPIKDAGSLQSKWTYTDDNSSILYPDLTDDRDLYGIPNVVEVVYSTDSNYLFSRIVNDDETSPVSTVTRGREIVYRTTNPGLPGEPNQETLDAYATQLLRNLSTLEHTVTYKHGYCDVRVGDCVTLNYKKAGLNAVRAVVQSQTITCETGCPVEETAVYTTKLWR